MHYSFARIRKIVILYHVLIRVLGNDKRLSVELPGGKKCLVNLRFLRLQRGQRLNLWYIGKRKQGFLRNHAIPQCTFLTPVGNRCITPCVCVKEPSPSRGVIPTAGGLYVHKGTVFCRNIRRYIQRYWILRRIYRSISCSAYRQHDRRE